MQTSPWILIVIAEFSMASRGEVELESETTVLHPWQLHWVILEPVMWSEGWLLLWTEHMALYCPWFYCCSGKQGAPLKRRVNWGKWDWFKIKRADNIKGNVLSWILVLWRHHVWSVVSQTLTLKSDTGREGVSEAHRHTAYIFKTADLKLAPLASAQIPRTCLHIAQSPRVLLLCWSLCPFSGSVLKNSQRAHLT